MNHPIARMRLMQKANTLRGGLWWAWRWFRGRGLVRCPRCLADWQHVTWKIQATRTEGVDMDVRYLSIHCDECGHEQGSPWPPGPAKRQ